MKTTAARPSDQLLRLCFANSDKEQGAAHNNLRAIDTQFVLLWISVKFPVQRTIFTRRHTRHGMLCSSVSDFFFLFFFVVAVHKPNCFDGIATFQHKHITPNCIKNILERRRRRRQPAPPSALADAGGWLCFRVTQRTQNVFM